MKKIITLTTFAAILLTLAGLTSCIDKEKNPILCIMERPKDLKPIDWENYNDVYTVYWTYHGREIREKEMETLLKDTANTIKVHGWVHRIRQSISPYSVHNFMEVVLIGNEIADDGNYSYFEYPYVEFTVVGDLEVMFLLLEKLTSADLTKKCFIRGKLCLSSAGAHIDFENGSCDIIFPRIRVYSVDDVYFK